MAKKDNKRTGIIILVVFIGLIIAVGVEKPYVSSTEAKEVVIPDWLSSYTASLPNDVLPYLKETTHYDYSSPEIQNAISEILSSAKNVDDAISLTLEYTYQNVNYDYKESDSICFERKASEILGRSTGQCDTMSRVNIAILRGMGIPARPEGGCLAIDGACYATFAVLGQRVPITQEIKETDGTASRAGGLHAWVEIYSPDGWVDGESTAGIIIEPTDCVKLVSELYPTTVVAECVSTDRSFIDMCKNL